MANFASTDIRHNPLYKNIDLSLLNDPNNGIRGQIHSKALYGRGGKLPKKLLRRLRMDMNYKMIVNEAASIYTPYKLETEESTKKLIQRLEQKNKILKIMNT